MAADIGRQMVVELARALEGLGARCVLIGGAAHELMASVAANRPRSYVPLRTNDADVAVDEDAGFGGERLDERIRQRGFSLSLSGNDVPPAERSVFEADPLGMHYVQMVARRRGDARHRTVRVAGVVAERPRHVDLLLLHPIRVELAVGDGYPVNADERLGLWVAHPACYVAQKLLARKDRDSNRRAKDLAYVYDTLVLFASDLVLHTHVW
jgi:hypothetical protein